MLQVQARQPHALIVHEMVPVGALDGCYRLAVLGIDFHLIVASALDAIDMARRADDAARAVYITNVMPWRPPHNRDPEPEEIAMMLPFVRRHIALIAPDVIVPMGNIACQALMGQKGITRLRGHWCEVDAIAALPMFHPAYLLRNAEKKRESWADLLEIKARLKGKTNAQN